MAGHERKSSESAMMKVCTFIVDKRNLFFLIFAILIVFSAFSRNWVYVENSLSKYLPTSTETRQGLDIMDNEFTTFGSARVMIANVSPQQASDIAEKIESMDGVASVDYDDTKAHYSNVSAYYNVTFEYEETDDKCVEAFKSMKQELSKYDCYISATIGNTTSETIASEMQVIIVIVAIVVVSVLTLTSQTYAEVAVLLLTFIAAAIISMGSNFWLGTISFVSNSVTIVLQLALSIDYAVILCNRFKEERENLGVRQAAIVSLSKSIPEISSSSLTTIGGLVAMTFMQFGIGPDMGIVLIKAIVMSLLSVFLLMPGLLVLFSKAMEKTRHKNFVPKIPFVGKFAYSTRFIIPPAFAVIIVVALFFSNRCPFVYGYSTLETPIKNENQIADEMIAENFGTTNMLALVVPAGDYEKEAKLMRELESRSEVDYCMGLANIEAMDGYTLTARLSPRQFAELTDMDYELVQLLYAAYAAEDEEYGKIVGGISAYSVPLIDMFEFLYKEVQEGYVTLDDDLMATLDKAYAQMQNGKAQLQGEEHSRMLVYLTLPQESEETTAFLSEIHSIAARYYSDPVYAVGDSTSQNDLRITFERDNTVVNVVSVLVVLAVLLVTFKSVGMPILLILVIQGSIWLNFAVPTIAKSNLFFMSYLIVSSIQMGANIDYAIVISSRYMELRKSMPAQKAIIDTMNLSFPTIITSGTMLAGAGVLIGQLTSEATIAGIGQCLGRGTVISIILVMFVLPQLLLLGDKVIEKTAFTVPSPLKNQTGEGLTRLDGYVRGEINGTVTGVVRGVVRGSVNVNVVSGIPGNAREPEEIPENAENTAEGGESADETED